MTDDTLTVDETTVCVTPYGLDSRGRAHFELADDHPSDLPRDVFPTDRGYVDSGRVYMLTPATAFLNSNQWVWTEIGVAGRSAETQDD